MYRDPAWMLAALPTGGKEAFRPDNGGKLSPARGSEPLPACSFDTVRCRPCGQEKAYETKVDRSIAIHAWCGHPFNGGGGICRRCACDDFRRLLWGLF